MVETASVGRQRPRPGRSSAASASDGARPDESDFPLPIAGAADQPSESRMNRIAQRAHEIYEARGGEHGKAIQDWLQAEREIDTELTDERGIDG